MAIQAIRANGGEIELVPSLVGETGAEFVVAFPLAGTRSHLTAVPDPQQTSDPGVPDPSAAARRDSPEKNVVPDRLLTPAGLKALLSLSRSGSEEMN
jgi:hypothetical protein